MWNIKTLQTVSHACAYIYSSQEKVFLRVKLKLKNIAAVL